MLDDLREEEVVNKVGGRFKLSTLIQKRLVQLNAGSRPLVETTETNNMAVALREIMEDKIFLDSSDEVRIAGEIPEGTDGPEFSLSDLTMGDE